MKKIYIFLFLFCVSSEILAMLVQLDDTSLHHFSDQEVESSATLLKKKLTRDRTRLSDIQKWGFDITQLPTQAPYLLHAISSSSLELFKNSLAIKAPDFNRYFNNLNETEQNDLIALVSQKKLGCPAILTQIIDNTLLLEIINKHIKPHLGLKTIIKKIRTASISNNARTNDFTHEKIDFTQQNTLCIFPNGTYSAAPSLLIKKEYCLFSGIDNHINTYYEHPLDRNLWTILAIKKKNNGTVHYVTSSLPNQNHMLTYSTHLIIWTCDLHDTILHKHTIAHENQVLQLLFSNEHHNRTLLASRSQAESNQVSPKIIITSLGEKSDDSETFSIILQHIAQVVYCLEFNPTANIIALGTTHTENALSTFNTSNGQLLQALSIPGLVHQIAFTPNGKKMVTASVNDSSDDIVHIWDTTNTSKIDSLTRITIGNNTLHRIFFNNTNTRMVGVVNDGQVIVIDMNNHDLLTLAKHDHNSNNLRSMALVFTHDNTFFVTTALTERDTDSNKNCPVKLWNAYDGTLLATLLAKQSNVCGIGITPNKQYVITTFSDNTCIKTALFDQKTYNLLKNIKHEMSLYSLYLLMRSTHAVL